MNSYMALFIVRLNESNNDTSYLKGNISLNK